MASSRMMLVSVPVALIAALLAWRASVPRLPPELKPLRAPLLTALPEFDAAYRSNMLWGSYRSGLYFGMRTRCGDLLPDVAGHICKSWPPKGQLRQLASQQRTARSARHARACSSPTLCMHPPVMHFICIAALSVRCCWA